MLRDGKGETLWEHDYIQGKYHGNAYSMQYSPERGPHRCVGKRVRNEHGLYRSADKENMKEKEKVGDLDKVFGKPYAKGSA